MSARNYLKNREKGGEIDYEIELLSNLMNSKYTSDKRDKQGNKVKNKLQDAYQIILD